MSAAPGVPSAHHAGYYENLAHYFHLVAFCEEIYPGPKAVTLLDHQVVLWRDPNGYPIAFQDLCGHQGTALLLGTVTERGCLQYPSHG